MYTNVLDAVFRLQEKQLELFDEEHGGKFDVVDKVYGTKPGEPDCFIIVYAGVYAGVTVGNLAIPV